MVSIIEWEVDPGSGTEVNAEFTIQEIVDDLSCYDITGWSTLRYAESASNLYKKVSWNNM